MTWQTLDTAPFANLDDDEYPLVLLWVEGGGWEGKGCQTIGYVLRRSSGQLVGKPTGYSGFTVKLWHPLPDGPHTGADVSATTERNDG